MIVADLLAVDPGVTSGWAHFITGTLVAAGFCKKGILLGVGVLPLQYSPLVLVEQPRWYPLDHKDVNDLLDLSVFVGEVSRHCVDSGCAVELVYPRTWKGTAPKPVTNERALRALSEAERGILPRRPRARDYDHNCLDAVGLGLWKLGRLGAAAPKTG